MADTKVMLDVLRGNTMFINMTLADMTDADLMKRPVPAANNGIWQLGHLIKSEAGMINECAGKTVAELPADFADKFKKSTAGENDPAKLGTKDELLALFAKTRESVAQWASSLSAEDLAKPAPQSLQQMCPTVGHVIALLPVHVGMHVGQWQVLRRSLGKPVLF